MNEIVENDGYVRVDLTDQEIGGICESCLLDGCMHIRSGMMLVYCSHNLRCAIKAPNREWIVKAGVERHIFESVFARAIFKRSLESEIKRDMQRIQYALNEKEKLVNQELAQLELKNEVKH
jgi:hypothetical protein